MKLTLNEKRIENCQNLFEKNQGNFFLTLKSIVGHLKNHVVFISFLFVRDSLPLPRVTKKELKSSETRDFFNLFFSSKISQLYERSIQTFKMEPLLIHRQLCSQGSCKLNRDPDRLVRFRGVKTDTPIWESAVVLR